MREGLGFVVFHTLSLVARNSRFYPEAVTSALPSSCLGSAIATFSDHGGHCNHGGCLDGSELPVLLQRSAQASTHAPSVGASACDRVGSWVWECSGEVGSSFAGGSR